MRFSIIERGSLAGANADPRLSRGGLSGSRGGAHVGVARGGRLERGRETAPLLGDTPRERRGVAVEEAEHRRAGAGHLRRGGARNAKQVDRARGLRLELERGGLEIVVERVGVDAFERFARVAELVGARVDPRRAERAAARRAALP